MNVRFNVDAAPNAIWLHYSDVRRLSADYVLTETIKLSLHQALSHTNTQTHYMHFTKLRMRGAPSLAPPGMIVIGATVVVVLHLVAQRHSTIFYMCIANPRKCARARSRTGSASVW